MVSVSCRAGWSLGSSLNRCLQKEAAGDQFVGRVVAGLPIHDETFAALPPRFDHDGMTAAAEVLPMLFGQAVRDIEHLRPVLFMCLASIVYHLEFLRRTVPTRSMLRSALPVLSDHRIMQELRPHVLDPMAPGSMLPTGVPAHVKLMAKIAEVTKSLEDERNKAVEVHRQVLEGQAAVHAASGGAHEALQGWMDNLVATVPLRVAELLEEQQVDSGDASSSTARKVIVRDFDTHLQRAVRDLEGVISRSMDGVREQFTAAASFATASACDAVPSEAAEQPAPAVDGAITAQYGSFIWGGRFRKLPQDFEMPRVSVYHAWKLWHLPSHDGTRELPPLCSVTRRFDVPSSQQHRYTIWHGVFKHLEEILRRDGKAIAVNL